ncbi:MAG: helix-turn-helix domain-containing protein [Magnetovibrio sp.]|nr:helix-turn-helix domain-containing protein [Magnetovibrio sp.]
MTVLSIGELSKRSKVNVETIRYYERRGILPAPPRTRGGHRVYADEHLLRLNFIRRSRELGFDLVSVRQMLGMVDGGNMTCENIREIATAHLDVVRSKIADLKRMETTLYATVARGDGGGDPECPILEALFDGGSEAPRR